MDTDNNTPQRYSRGLLRIVAILAATAFIVAFYPKESDFPYNYTVGKPWRYGQMIAEYDFPIYKTEAAIRLERDSVLKTFRPYFRQDAQAGRSQTEALARDCREGGLKDVPSAYVQHVSKLMETVYGQGLMDSHEYSALLDSGTTAVRIEQGTTAVYRNLKNVFTTRSAYIYILSMADSVHFRREVLDRMNINNYLTTNLVYDQRKSAQSLNDLRNSVSYATGVVLTGEKIVDRGEIVTPHIASILESLKTEIDKRHQDKAADWLRIGGESVFTLCMLLLFTLYLKLNRRDYLRNGNRFAMLYLLIVTFAVGTMLVAEHNPINVYAVPITAIAIFVSVFMDTRTAFVTQLITVTTASLHLQDPYVFCCCQLVPGVVAIYSLKELTSRSQIIRTAVLATLATFAFMLSYDLSMGHELKNLDTSWYANVGIGGVLLIMTFPFIFIVERFFNFISPATLLELSNVNNPLLRRLSKEAIGTFNHSMQVANLASEVADKLGANILLVRTGALYHDIGKLQNPAYFTENQVGTNPHDSLPEERSASIIISHIKDGLKLASSYKLPNTVRDFIATHHGCSKATYFYINYKNNHPNEHVDESIFTYPGPNPQTKEQAILMMCDSVEAASKSLKTIDEESITALVNNIVDSKVRDGYLADSPLTFRDIRDAKKVLIQSLKAIYHSRISYPKLNEEPGEPLITRGTSIFGHRRTHSGHIWNK